MNDQQTVTAPSSNPGVFGTKIPSSVAYGIGLLLFLLPFVDIRCNNMILQEVSGVQLATGFQVEQSKFDSDNDDDDLQIKGDMQTRQPNLFALAALVLGLVAFILNLLRAKSSVSGAVISGALCVVALIGLMIDIKRQVRLDIPDKSRKASGLEKFGESMHIGVDFTPWFYITIIAFAVGTFFCYRRIQQHKW